VTLSGASCARWAGFVRSAARPQDHWLTCGTCRRLERWGPQPNPPAVAGFLLRGPFAGLVRVLLRGLARAWLGSGRVGSGTTSTPTWRPTHPPCSPGVEVAGKQVPPAHQRGATPSAAHFCQSPSGDRRQATKKDPHARALSRSRPGTPPGLAWVLSRHARPYVRPARRAA
jgi:hypothetical protein